MMLSEEINAVEEIVEIQFSPSKIIPPNESPIKENETEDDFMTTQTEDYYEANIKKTAKATERLKAKIDE
jgi:septal ring factor EnvC (AmiA/AmiB activator)